MKKTSLYIAILFCLFTADLTAQQITRRTQFAFNPYMVNPAVAGTLNQIPIFASYRNQWAGFKGAPVTMLASAHMQGPKNSGFGAIISHDDTGGAISETGIEATGAYHIDLNNYDAVSFGLSLTASQYKFDNSKLVVYDQMDQSLNNMQAESHMNIDANFGMMIYGEDYYFGFSVPQLAQTKLKLESPFSSENKNMRHFQFMGSYKYFVNDDFDIQPSGLIKFTPVTPVQLDVNVKVGYKEMAWAGITYRNNDAVALNLGGFYENFFLGYSFDLTTSAAKVMSPFSHEILLGYIIPGKRGKYIARGALGPRTVDRNRIVKAK
ncbi:MAG: type IX secretion system membrane protein PorP/SprF [Flavobacteriales bacterium]|nr:type IX secretion system membrane protein PorP/SprF [Flavobacteriales bacterium]